MKTIQKITVISITVCALAAMSGCSNMSRVAPVTQVDASTHTNVDLTNVTKSLSSVGSLLGGVKV